MKEKALKQLKEIEKHSDLAKEKGMRLAAEDWETDFQTLIAIILSARTLDETTIRVCKELFRKFPNAETLSKASLKEVEEIILPINFYQNKAKYVIACANKIMEKHNGNVPHSFDKLVELPGVGRKTANVFLAKKGKDEIGVDTHLSYISRYLGWTKNKTQEKIEQDLKALFPREHWKKLNPTLVRFGKIHTNRLNKNEILDRIKEIG